MPAKTLPILSSEFESVTGHRLDFPADYQTALDGLCSHLDAHALRPPHERRRWLLGRINAKFRFNRDSVAAVYAHAASRSVSFNYHEKTAIQLAFDLSDREAYARALAYAGVEAGYRDELLVLFAPMTESETIRQFALEVNDPSKLRRDMGDRRVDLDILLAAFSAFVFSAAEEEVLHAYFDKSYDPATYERSFWLQLRRMYPRLYTRNRALEIVALPSDLATRCEGYSDLRSRLLACAAESYAKLNNHGYLAVWLPPVRIGSRTVTWELASDLMLFAEKHDEVALKKTYFRYKEVEKTTRSYIKRIDIDTARFDLANEGFTYKDTFVCVPDSVAQCGEEALLVLFQKNKRDETLIPCPACRSHDVQGNSYPSLGVRSWECRNLLCPDRSKYNRGKRYSFKALLMQEAIDDPDNEIPLASVRAWARDVQVGRSFIDCVQMLIRHYSLHGDTVRIVGSDSAVESLGRDLDRAPFPETDMGQVDSFFTSAWFRRYIVEVGLERVPPRESRLGRLRLLNGDARHVLGELPDDYFDGAVTSPPYYNAREYAQWDNIYCYLHDMYRIASECFRVLKPGAPYLYNIFDYFDNERSIVFSAMGTKRLILSAYTVDLFRRCGFELAGSVTWDKGDIEGKRGFNAGNFSPFYQSPFNCWEHVLVFVKPPAGATGKLPAVLRAQPVIKMVNGENVHGHTAPFPVEIPQLLDCLVLRGGRILDPFGGSATTARALARAHEEVVCVERSKDYCALAAKMFQDEFPDPAGIKRAGSRDQLALFNE
ncbi:MAG: site-specific DNA-methyltransferase [Nannocystis sp.]|nr:site-specific DNA-methyltransferase [Nannocystis sp.]